MGLKRKHADGLSLLQAPEQRSLVFVALITVAGMCWLSVTSQL